MTNSSSQTSKKKGPIGPADSAMRSKENAVVRSKFGASTSDFSCRYDLLENFNGEDGLPQLKSTTDRECAERRFEICKVQAEAWKYKAAAARLKLARLNSFDGDARKKQAAQIEVVRCDLKVKGIEFKIANLKREESERLVSNLKKLESKDREVVSDLKSTMKAKSEYKMNVADPKRDIYYFSYCRQEGHAPWYCAVLDKRKKWFEYPSKKWFITSKGTQLYCPEGNVMMDFSDQQVYSKVTSDIKGNECITDKGALANLNLAFTPKTYHIKECKWVGEEPPIHPPGATEKNPGVWFVKDTLRNYSTGIFMARTKEECIKISEKENSYVVQAQIVPLLIENRKSHIRTYYLMYSPIDSTDIRFFMYRDGYLALALKEYKFDNLDRDVQVTRDRTCRMSERLPFYADALPQIVSTLCQLSSAIKPKLRPSKDKSNFMIVGLDLMLDHQKFVWMLEANAGPVVRGADFPHIKAMIDLVIPQGYEGDSEKDIVNKLWYEIMPLEDELKRNEFSKKVAASIVSELSKHVDEVSETKSVEEKNSASIVSDLSKRVDEVSETKSIEEKDYA